MRHPHLFANKMKKIIAILIALSSNAVIGDSDNELILNLSCTFKAMYSTSGNLFVTRDQMKDAEFPRVFSITAKKTGEGATFGQFGIGKTHAIGQLSGDFTFLLEPRVVEWHETDGYYYFKTLAVKEVYHSVFIDRLKGS